MKIKGDATEIAVHILRLWQEWASIGTVHQEHGDPWPNCGRQADLYRKLWLFVQSGEIRDFVVNGVIWADNEIGDVGRGIHGEEPELNFAATHAAVKAMWSKKLLADFARGVTMDEYIKEK